MIKEGKIKLSNLKIKHFFYKKRRWEKIKNLKHILLFAFYFTVIALILKMSNNKFINIAFGKMINEKSVYSNRLSNDNNGISIDKLKLIFFTNIIGNEEIAKDIVRYSAINKVDPILLVSLIRVESNFNQYAININKNGSIDRGLCQLNNKTFPDLKEKDLFNPEINIKHGSEFLKWCLDSSDNNIVKALAFYNAGIGSVRTKKVGESTLNYINYILDYKNSLKIELNNFLTDNLDLAS